jgi:hypothetical protein
VAAPLSRTGCAHGRQEPTMMPSRGTSSESVSPAMGSPLWTVEGCLHSGKTDLARFLAEETELSFNSLLMTPKQVLAERLCELLHRDPAAAERAIRELPVTVGFTPRELEAALGCTRTERRRWVAEGRLQLCGTMRLRLKNDRWVDVNLVDRRAVAALAPGELESWRAEHEQLVIERRRAGIADGLERRARTLALQRQAVGEVEQLQISWLERSGGDLLAVAALTLAHWTVWASRRAKWHRAEAAYGGTYQVMGTGRPARRPSTRHWSQEQRWYSLKDQALRLLAETGRMEVRLYQPGWLWIEELCADHYDDWCEERGYLHTSFGEYVLQHAKDLSRCPQCTRDPWHYALYSLELRLPFLEEVCYRFHVPYSIGEAYLPKPGKLAHVVEADAAEGLFGFGRPLENEEVTKYSAPFIERHLAHALDELEKLLGTGDEPDGELPAEMPALPSSSRL